MPLVTEDEIKRAVGGGAGVWRDDLAEVLAGALRPDPAAAIADASAATGIANNADEANPVTLVSEHDALVGKVNDILAALRANGIVAES